METPPHSLRLRTRPAPPRPAPGTRRPGSGVGATLAVSGGLGAGPRFDLPGGRHVIGRSANAAVVLADPTVSRCHAEATVGPAGSVELVDLGSTNGTRVDGCAAAEPTLLDGDSVAQLGSVLLRTVPAVPASQPGPRPDDGSPTPPRLFNRPPTAGVVGPPPPLVPPSTTAAEHGPAFAWASLLAPLAVGLVLAVVISPLMALFALVGPVLFLATWFEQHRRGRRRTRRRGRRFRHELGHFQEAAARRHREAASRARTAHPDPPTLLVWADAGAARLWSIRPGGPGFLHVSVGTADIPWEPDLAPLDGAPLAPEVTLALAALGPVISAPVVVDLAEGAVGLVGPRTAALAVARHLLLQLCIRTGPADIRIGVAVDDEQAEDWAWANALPHTRPLPHGDDRWSVVLFDGEATNDTRPGLQLALGREARRTGIVVAEAVGDLPASCRAVIELVDDDGTAAVRWPADDRNQHGVLATGIRLTTAAGGAVAVARFRDPDDIEARPPKHGDLLDLSPATCARWENKARWLPIGLGEDDLEPVGLLLHDGEHAIVSGPPGSGRSTALVTIATLAAAPNPAATRTGDGHTTIGPVVLALTPRPSPLASCAAVTTAVSDPEDLVVELVRHADRPVLVLVDDAEMVTDPAEVLMAIVTGPHRPLHVVAAGHIERLRSASDHWTRVVRQSQNGLLLGPDPAVDGDLLGVSLPWHSDATGQPGRGWLVSGGALAIVQVAHP